MSVQTLQPNRGDYTDTHRGVAETQSHDPRRRTLAGEVSRRTDRTTDALPPPGPQGSGNGGSKYNNNARGRRRNVALGGGSNDDSDHDEDDRKRKPKDEGGVLVVRRPEEKMSEREIPAHVLERMKAEQQAAKNKRMNIVKQLYACLKQQAESSIAEADQVSRQIDILQQLPVGSRYSSASPRMQTAMFEYVTQVDAAMLNSFSDNISLQSGISQIILHLDLNDFDAWPETLVQRNYWGEPPRCSLYLENTESVKEYAYSLFYKDYEHYPVLQVLMSGYTPVGLKPITHDELERMGWKRTEEGTWWRYQRGKTESTRDIIFRVRMTGHVEEIWTGPDEIDPNCEVYLEKLLDERKRKERRMALKRRAEKLFGPII
ncbi:hypothetical protein BJY00DRAFT_291716 [Aspergillus carlsbadensis]|nr:hypothetical protein BJY00DRAFT_291716 [Aspergillus carlsbadensis]